MLTHIHPKLPMRNKTVTAAYYTQLGFQQAGGDYPDYLMMKREAIEVHFFLFPELDPKENYGQIYIRTNDIEALYAEMNGKLLNIHPNGRLQTKPWGQREFSMLDPDHNLLTFGQGG